jgi:hypothetical protein
LYPRPSTAEAAPRVRRSATAAVDSPESVSPYANGKAQESIMAKAGSRIRKRVWKKVVVAVMAGIVAVGSLIYWERYKIVVWYLDGNKKAQEQVILQLLEIAKPIIKRDFTMTFFEKIYSTLAGNRNEKERQTDALKDVRSFSQSAFENHRLKFENVHKLGSLNGFNLQGFDFALEWNRGNMEDVLMAFDVNFLKREIGKIQINDKCSFFTELRLYIEKKAKEN